MSSLILGVPEGERIKQLFEQTLQQQGLKISILPKHIKEGVFTAIRDNDDVEYVVIHYKLESIKPFLVSELSRMLAMKSDLKIIIILPNDFKGQSFVTELYNKGFYSGIFEEDASLSNTSALIAKARTKEEARDYYSLPKTSLISSVNKEKIRKNVMFLSNKADTQLDFPTKLEHVHSMLSTEEFLHVLQNLSESIVEEIAEIDDYRVYFSEEPTNTKKRGLFKSKKSSKTSAKQRIKAIAELPDSIVASNKISKLIPQVNTERFTRVREESREVSRLAGIKSTKKKQETLTKSEKPVSVVNKPKRSETLKHNLIPESTQKLFEEGVKEVSNSKVKRTEELEITKQPISSHPTTMKPPEHKQFESRTIGVRKPIQLKSSVAADTKSTETIPKTKHVEDTHSENVTDSVLEIIQPDVLLVQPTEEQSTEVQLTEEQSIEEQSTEVQPTEEQSTEVQLTEEQSIEEQSTEVQPTEEQSIEVQPTEEQSIEEQPIEEQSTEEQSIEEQSTEVQPTEEQSIEEQPTEEQSTEEQSIEEQPTEEQPTEEQPTEEQSIEDGKSVHSETPSNGFAFLFSDGEKPLVTNSSDDNKAPAAIHPEKSSEHNQSKSELKQQGLEFWNKILQETDFMELEPDIIISEDLQDKPNEPVELSKEEEEEKDQLFSYDDKNDSAAEVEDTVYEEIVSFDEHSVEESIQHDSNKLELNIDDIPTEETININEEPPVEEQIYEEQIYNDTSTEEVEQAIDENAINPNNSESEQISEIESLSDIEEEENVLMDIRMDNDDTIQQLASEEAETAEQLILQQEKEFADIEDTSEEKELLESREDIEEPTSEDNTISKPVNIVVNDENYTDERYNFMDTNKVDMFDYDDNINPAAIFSDSKEQSMPDIDTGNAYVKDQMNELNEMLNDIDMDIDTSIKDVKLPNFKSMDFSKYSTGIKSGKNVIGVCGLSPKCGNTFIALNCAKAISDTGNSTAIVEIPYLTRASIYNDIALEDALRNSYQSVFVKNRKDRLFDINTYMGVDFLVIDSICELEDWQLADTLDILSRINETVVIDMGTDLAAVNRSGMLNVLSEVVLVVDVDNLEQNIEALRIFKEKIRQVKITPTIVFNNTDVKKSEPYHRFFDASYNYMCIPTVNHSVQNPFVLKKHEYRRLLSYIHFEQDEGSSKSARDTSSTVTKIGSIDIGFMGVEYGVGTTHSSIMCASVLKSDFRVCILEVNDTGHFRRLYEYIYGKEPTKNDCMFSSLGIDFYFHISYTEFSAKYRQRYDCVLVDFGEYPCQDMEEFIRCNKKFIVAQGSEWKRLSLMKCYESLYEKDTMGDWVYLVPFANSSSVKEIRKQCCPYNSVVAVPFLSNPYMVDDNIIQIFYKELGLPMKKKKKLFSR